MCCDVCAERKGCTVMGQFLSIYLFTMYSDNPAECRLFREENWRGLDGVRR